MVVKAERPGYFVHKCHLSNPYPGSIKEILILTEEGLREKANTRFGRWTGRKRHRF